MIEMDSEVIIQYFANAISTVTILSCLFLKVPQILNVTKKQSAEGIYIQALLMEITGYSITTLYNYTNHYNVMTYLEYPIILVQIYVLFYYVLKYKKCLSVPVVPIGVILYAATVVGFASCMLPKDILSFLVPFCTPLSGFAKVTYIYGIIKAGNADAVSLQTWIISVLTNLSRLFTVYVDSADIKLMINFAVSTFLSGGVLCTAMYYQKLASRTKKGTARKRSRASNKYRSHED